MALNWRHGNCLGEAGGGNFIRGQCPGRNFLARKYLDLDGFSYELVNFAGVNLSRWKFWGHFFTEKLSAKLYCEECQRGGLFGEIFRGGKTDRQTDGRTESLQLVQRSALRAMRTRCKNAMHSFQNLYILQRFKRYCNAICRSIQVPVFVNLSYFTSIGAFWPDTGRHITTIRYKASYSNSLADRATIFRPPDT